MKINQLIKNFNYIDINKDNYIDKIEYSLYHSFLHDHDGDGKLSLKEVIELPLISKHFKLIDLNNDTYLDSYEVLTFKVFYDTVATTTLSTNNNNNSKDKDNTKEYSNIQYINKSNLNHYPILLLDYTIIDLNKDSLIDKYELASYFKLKQYNGTIIINNIPRISNPNHNHIKSKSEREKDNKDKQIINAVKKTENHTSSTNSNIANSI